MTKAEAILEAENEIRREGAKAAFFHAVLESVFVLVGVTFLVIGMDAAPGFVPEVGPFSAAVVMGAFAAVVFFSIDFYLTYRRRTLEAFEKVNPNVDEALRTARDVAHEGEESEIVERLYDDVLTELRNSSSEGFINTKRVAASFALVLGIAFLLLTASFGGVGGGDGIFGSDGLGGFGGDEADEGGDEGGEGQGMGEGDEDEMDSEDVLGGESDLIRGEDDGSDFVLRQTGQAGGDGDVERGTPESTDGFPEGDVDSARAEFSPEEEIEDAELVKEYNLRIAGEE